MTARLSGAVQRDETLLGPESAVIRTAFPGSTNAARGAPPAAARPNAQDEPAWLKPLEAQPAAAAEARQWREAAKDMAALDAAYFSGDAGRARGLAARLYESDPAAFRAMLAESARMLASRDPQALAELARQLGMRKRERRTLRRSRWRRPRERRSRRAAVQNRRRRGLEAIAGNEAQRRRRISRRGLSRV